MKKLLIILTLVMASCSEDSMDLPPAPRYNVQVVLHTDYRSGLPPYKTVHTEIEVIQFENQSSFEVSKIRKDYPIGLVVGSGYSTIPETPFTTDYYYETFVKSVNQKKIK